MNYKSKFTPEEEASALAARRADYDKSPSTPSPYQTIEMLYGRIKELEALLILEAEWVVNFKKYAQHKRECQVWRPIVGCDCGLKELLEKI